MKTSEFIERLNCGELATALKKSGSYVTAMRRAGYVLEYEALGQTTLEHALSALKASPDFKADHYLTKGWERRPKLLAASSNQAALASGKSC